jgi:glutamate synthase (NADPH/NADH) small chain
MSILTGFIEFSRELPERRPVAERLGDFNEVEGPVDPTLSRRQSARCMNCGTPFCHAGCPLGNNIPEFNNAVASGNWRLAYEILRSTNNFPEFTGRICPAPCEASCVLAINKPAVTVEYLEKSIIENAFVLGLVTPVVPDFRTGKRVAIVGSGPAGLAAASQLNAAGHSVTVFERSEAPGGLLRFGIPDFKMEKAVLDRRIELMKAEGIEFRVNEDLSEADVKVLRAKVDAILMAVGATRPRDLPIPGRDLKGIHFAMDFLTHQNRAGHAAIPPGDPMSASGKDVIILGGGDTGADCLGTALRQGARSVTQLEILDRPPMERTDEMPWPEWPLILRNSTSHDEGGIREWSTLTKSIQGDLHGTVCGLSVVSIAWSEDRRSFTEQPGTKLTIPCHMVLLAMGFNGVEESAWLRVLGLAPDDKGRIGTALYQTESEGVFAAGDARRGQSLVVWAIHEGREAARAMDEFLMGTSVLEARDKGALTEK